MTIETLFNSSNFAASFFGDLFAGLFITLAVSIFVPWYLDWRKRPVIRFLNQCDESELFEFSSRDPGSELSLNLKIKNFSNRTFDRYYWHLLIPAELFPQFPSNTNNISLLQEVINGGKTIHSYGLMEAPLFPDRGFDFPFQGIKLRPITRVKPKIILYYFSTEFGSFPRDNFFDSEIRFRKKYSNFLTIT